MSDDKLNEESYIHSASKLKSTIIERIAHQSIIVKRIAQHLDKQRDRFNFCLVLNAWSPAAVNVLWSEPIFNSPESFHSFVSVVRKARVCALRVRVLDLCIPENEVMSSFVPVLKSL
ncbi:3771_t:CDS:1, partial [Acaulospora colombiana]